MLYAIQRYTDWDADTTAFGPYESMEEAWTAAKADADDTAKSRSDGVGIDMTVNPDRDNWSILVYATEYDDSEPTDDERHVRYDIQSLVRL